MACGIRSNAPRDFHRFFSWYSSSFHVFFTSRSYDPFAQPLRAANPQDREKYTLVTDLKKENQSWRQVRLAFGLLSLRRSVLTVGPAISLSVALVFSFAPIAVLAESGTDAGSGRILGSVEITRKLTSQRMRFRPYPGTRQLPPPSSGDLRTDEWRNIVVYLQSDARLLPATPVPDTLEVAQQGETFIPHILPVVQGSTVEFPNNDPIFHNVFSLSAAKTFDLGRYPQGTSRSVTFEQPGIVAVFCHLHSNMSAIVLVLDNPYFVIPDENGAYQLDGIPAGKYTLVAWHERSERVEQSVEVAPGADVEVNLTVPIDDDELSDG